MDFRGIPLHEFLAAIKQWVFHLHPLSSFTISTRKSPLTSQEPPLNISRPYKVTYYLHTTSTSPYTGPFNPYQEVLGHDSPVKPLLHGLHN
ncbi:hypothetical protein E2C01_013713 [Portunus trituberculatus]|uniref:Uncharacterized protein n=1 Tax=Portunus trituberculatus TaxID=210409 RepID=A0A5B7DHX1_PORTR|nr:hypothetical protein [Portunus trituberculatus]